MKLQFLGGVQTVTGSKTLFRTGRSQFLVDCGLFQGLKELRLRNRMAFPVEPSSIDAIFLTHAHLDHSGYIPLLVKNGFNGKIFCSSPTRDLAELILKDSAKLNEEDADFANRHGFSKHSPAMPLYTVEDVEKSLKRFETISINKWNENLGSIKFKLSPSAHILGSTFIELDVEGRRIVFSGDLGRSHPMLYEPPTRVEHADYLVVESTYGDRTRHLGTPTESSAHRLGRIVAETFNRNGQLIIPSFAVGRVQELLLMFANLKTEKKIPDIPIYLDSPMGINATQIFLDYPEWHKLSQEEVKKFSEVAKIVHSQQESIQIMRDDKPVIIIAGSGMVSGGRVLHHLAARLPDERNTVLLVGFQAAGTRGRLLKERIGELKIHGKYIEVKARIEELTDLSAHADQTETLEWLSGFKTPPKMTFINHGEAQASDALRVKISDNLGWKCIVPKVLEELTLS